MYCFTFICQGQVTWVHSLSLNTSLFHLPHSFTDAHSWELTRAISPHVAASQCWSCALLKVSVFWMRQQRLFSPQIIKIRLKLHPDSTFDAINGLITVNQRDRLFSQIAFYLFWLRPRCRQRLHNRDYLFLGNNLREDEWWGSIGAYSQRWTGPMLCILKDYTVWTPCDNVLGMWSYQKMLANWRWFGQDLLRKGAVSRGKKWKWFITREGI